MTHDVKFYYAMVYVLCLEITNKNPRKIHGEV